MRPQQCSCCLSVEIEPDDQFCIDCATLVDTAIKAISQARQDGVPIYGPETWRQANMAHRLDHAATHIYQYKRGERDEDHLAHAICDLVFVYATKS